MRIATFEESSWNALICGWTNKWLEEPTQRIKNVQPEHVLQSSCRRWQRPAGSMHETITWCFLNRQEY